MLSGTHYKISKHWERGATIAAGYSQGRQPWGL